MVLVNLGTSTPFPEDGIVWSSPNPAQSGNRYLLQFEINANEPTLVLSYFNFFFEADGHNQAAIVTPIPGRYFVRNGVRQATFLDLSNSFAASTPVRVGVQRIPVLPSYSQLASATVQGWIDTDDTIPITT